MALERKRGPDGAPVNDGLLWDLVLFYLSKGKDRKYSDFPHSPTLNPRQSYRQFLFTVGSSFLAFYQPDPARSSHAEH